MKKLLLRLVLVTMCVVAAASANAQQGNWGNFVFISSTLGNNGNKLCLGEGLRGSDIGCPTYAPTVLPGGYVGIGNNTPTVALSVNGEVQVSNSSVACSGSTKGSIRYSNTSNTLEYCNSSQWTGVTNTTDASLTAFTVVKTATQSLATIGSLVTWESVVTNNGNGFNLATERFTAPANGYYFFVFSAVNNADTSFGDFYLYKNAINTSLRSYGGQGSETYKSSTLQGVLFLSAGDYVDIRSSGNSMSLYGAAGGPVTTFTGFLLNAGSGASSGGSSTPAGSTGDVQFNTAGALDADTGKFTYTPATGMISASGVSVSTILTTYLQIQSATSVLACGNSLAGTMRYTSGTMQVCNGSSWGNIGLGVPTGTIAAFAEASCPLGWTEYTPSRGRFLRGIDNGAGLDPSGTRSPGNMQTDALQNIVGSMSTQSGVRIAGGTGPFGALSDPISNGSAGGSGVGNRTIAFNLSLAGRTSTETRPVNVAVTYCMYAGFESQLQTGVATLASLSDVSINGATAGQSLIFNGAAWIASTTTQSSSAALADRITSGTASLIANNNLGISSSVPLEVSGTIKMAGTGSEACVSATVGTFRVNPINGVPQICR